MRFMLLVFVVVLGWRQSSCGALLAHPPSKKGRAARETPLFSQQRRTAEDADIDLGSSSLISRKNLFSELAWITMSASVASLSLLAPPPARAAAADDPTTSSSYSIASCVKPSTGGPANCVSTASVKQVDLYMAPWTWPEGVAVDEVVGRLKGVIDADPALTLVEQRDSRYFRVRAARNFNTDEIEFVVNPADRVVTFRSQQVEGPESVSDFGGNRKRLEEIRKRIPFLQVMGAEFDSADSGPREGVGGQLKAFWGLQSGGGYEKVLLDEDFDDDY